MILETVCTRRKTRLLEEELQVPRTRPSEFEKTANRSSRATAILGRNSKPTSSLMARSVPSISRAITTCVHAATLSAFCVPY